MRFKYANVVATLALVVAIGGSAVAAGAQELITGRDVQDGSLTGADVQNHSLTGADIASGSLGSGLFSAQARANLQGANGAVGAKGDIGPAGPQGPAGAGVSVDTVSGADAVNYQDLTPLATTTQSRSGDYVLFATLSAHNTGSVDDNLNCGLFAGDQEFGGGGTSPTAGATTSFSTVGAIHIDAATPVQVVLKCQGGGVTTYDLTNIQIRIHDLG
jgi:hypothetical protein